MKTWKELADDGDFFDAAITLMREAFPEEKWNMTTFGLCFQEIGLYKGYLPKKYNFH